MNKKRILIVGSLLAVFVLILASFTNVVGVKNIEPSDPKVVKDEVNPKELLFQTIIDISNNQEIQKIIQNSENREERGRFFNLVIGPSVFSSHVLTKKFLNNAYNLGRILSRNIDVSKMRLILERYQIINQETQEEIAAAIEGDAALSGKIEQLSTLNCDCGNDDSAGWSFPIICTLLVPLLAVSLGLAIWNGGVGPGYLLGVVMVIGSALNCFWA